MRKKGKPAGYHPKSSVRRKWRKEGRLARVANLSNTERLLTYRQDYASVR